MSFHTSAVCDNCEQHLQADNEDVILAHGWMLLRYIADEEDVTRDFCSFHCLDVWAGRKQRSTPLPELQEE